MKRIHMNNGEVLDVNEIRVFTTNKRGKAITYILDDWRGVNAADITDIEEVEGTAPEHDWINADDICVEVEEVKAEEKATDEEPESEKPVNKKRKVPARNKASKNTESTETIEAVEEAIA